jgi:hypothetical protein
VDRRTRGNTESLAARLTIASILDDARGDPETFARLILALATVRQVDARKIARLLVQSASGTGR